MTKRELRKAFLKKRQDLSDLQVEEFNRKLREHLFSSIDLADVQVLHTFLPIERNREVDTWSIIRQARELYPGLRIVVPRMTRDESALEHFYLEREEQLRVNALGIPEPISGARAEAADLDLILVPLLAFDVRGHRLGYGGGYYDRFLASCRPDCVKVGLSFFNALPAIIDLHENDVALDKIVTPTGVFIPEP